MLCKREQATFSFSVPKIYKPSDKNGLLLSCKCISASVVNAPGERLDCFDLIQRILILIKIAGKDIIIYLQKATQTSTRTGVLTKGEPYIYVRTALQYYSRFP